MRDNVTISYRGASYELGEGPRCYGIWAIGTPRSEPLERWPDTAEGWSAASARFTELEAPAAIAPVSRDRPARASTLTGTIVAAAVLGLGVACGIAGLFPAYLGQSLAHQASDLVAHLIYLAAWTASGVLIVLGGRRLRVGALIGLGTSLVTFGLFFADAGEAIAGQAPWTTGLALGLAGWLSCAAGSVLAVRLKPAGSTPDGPGLPGRRAERRYGDGHRIVALWSAVIAGAGAAIAFAPAWDKYTLNSPAGQLQSLTAGDAFKNPAPVIAGDVAVMVAVVLAVLLAVLWRPARLGAALLAGVIIPLAAQAVSALVQVSELTPSSALGIPARQAARDGLTISSGVTPAFWVYCAFLVALALSCAQLLSPPDAVTPAGMSGAPAQLEPGSATPSTDLPAAGSTVSGGLPATLYMVPASSAADSSET